MKRQFSLRRLVSLEITGILAGVVFVVSQLHGLPLFEVPHWHGGALHKHSGGGYAHDHTTHSHSHSHSHIHSHSHDHHVHPHEHPHNAKADHDHLQPRITQEFFESVANLRFEDIDSTPTPVDALPSEAPQPGSQSAYYCQVATPSLVVPTVVVAPPMEMATQPYPARDSLDGIDILRLSKSRGPPRPFYA